MIFPVLAAHKYAGYYYYGTAGSPPQGVSAVIYTIDKLFPTPGEHFYCQWVTIVLSYSNGYWVQVGYNKGFDSPSLTWYTEIYDSGGYELDWQNETYNPSSGNTYHYYIYSSDDFTMGVSGKFSVTNETSPTSYVDFQAMCETTDISIDIDGTDFDEISYKQGEDWDFWTRHVVKEDWPYDVTEWEDYDFDAEGSWP